MNKHLLFLISMFLCPAALARVAALPLHDVIGRSAAVVDVTILSVRSATYSAGERQGFCGFIYEARISESFKGQLSGNIVFASDAAMLPQKRHLLFLHNHDGDFPRDNAVSFDGEEQRARDTCISNLPRLKSGSLHTGDMIYPPMTPVTWYVRMSNWIRVPAEMMPMSLEVREVVLDGKTLQADAWPQDAPLPPNLYAQNKLVEWTVLRPWLLQHAADIVDASPLESGCDATCSEVALQQTWDLRERLSEISRRWTKDSAILTDALNRARNAGSLYEMRTCELYVLAWPKGKPGVPLGSCKLRMAQATTRELWLARNSPGSLNTYAPVDECDDACVTRKLDEATATMNERVRESQRSLDARGVSFSVEGSQDRWANYMQAQCNLIALAWKEGDPGGPLSQRCRLRLTTSRIADLTWLYQ